jgi:hypothetical protein
LRHDGSERKKSFQNRGNEGVRREPTRIIVGSLKKLVFKIILAGVGAVILVAVLVRHFSREPSHKGRPLSAWAADLRSGEGAVRQSALEALKESPDAVAFLSKTVAAGPGPVERSGEYLSKILPSSMKRSFRRIYDPGRRLLDRHLAAQALQQLGTNAEAAVPALGKMLRDSNVLLASSAGQH